MSSIQFQTIANAQKSHRYLINWRKWAAVGSFRQDFHKAAFAERGTLSQVLIQNNTYEVAFGGNKFLKPSAKLILIHAVYTYVKDAISNKKGISVHQRTSARLVRPNCKCMSPKSHVFQYSFLHMTGWIPLKQELLPTHRSLRGINSSPRTPKLYDKYWICLILF